VSTASEELPHYTLEQYLAVEEASQVRHEFVGGRIYAMSGGTERHDLLTGLIYEVLAAAARREGCRPFIANRQARVGSAHYYPDVMIVCARSAERLYETDASLIVEVSSRSTVDTDRREKASAYATLPGLSLYVLVDPERRRIEVAQRRSDGDLLWRVFGPEGVVPTRYGALDVDALYDALDATAIT